jgi:hypothetical protein
MDINEIDDYVYTRILDLDLYQQKRNANIMYNYVVDTFIPDVPDLDEDQQLITKYFSKYNYLMSPIPGMTNLYENIKDSFHFIIREKKHNVQLFDEYHIQCWVNFYQKGNAINWHSHWPTNDHSWHGFYCVNVEPNSETIYRIDGRKVPEDDIHVESKNNLLVLSSSGRDKHRSSEWHSDEPRITVAFDIVPTEILFLKQHHLIDINHWIPI